MPCLSVFLMISTLSLSLCPFSTRALITFVEERDPYHWKGWLFAVAMFVADGIAIVSLHHYQYICCRTSMGVHTAMVGTIYRKVSYSLLCTACNITQPDSLLSKEYLSVLFQSASLQGQPGIYLRPCNPSIY